MPDQKKATIFALCTVAIWSTVASAFKLSLACMDHVHLLLFSSLTATLCLGGIATFRKAWAPVIQAGPREWGRSMLFGLVNPFLYYLVLFKAYALLPAQEAQALNYTWGITLALLAVPLLGQRIRAVQLLAIIISYFGVVIIATRGDLLGLDFSNPEGVAYAMGSTLIWSLYWIFNTRDRMEPIPRLFLNFAFGTIYIAIAAPFLTEPAWPGTAGLAGAVYVGLFEMAVPFILWLTALRLTESAARISHFIYLSPLLSLVFIAVFVGEKILVSTLAGLGLILAGTAIQKHFKG